MSKFRKLGLNESTKNLLINKALDARQKNQEKNNSSEVNPTKRGIFGKKIDSRWNRFNEFDGIKEIEFLEKSGRSLGVNSPFFKTHDGIAGATSSIDGKTYINYSSYNYLGLGGNPKVIQASKDALDHYGTTVSASRMVSGERPIQQQLESEISSLYNADDSLVFVSGHATNVTTIGYLFGPKDLILYDSLCHNSILQGAVLSGSKILPFRHNDWAHLNEILIRERKNFERVLIAIEGLYSMDGDIPDLEKFIEVKQRHHSFLMVDEAHSIGVLGKTGRGIAEHFDVNYNDVDIWMGTLSKSFASCGGYIAGESSLIKHLRHYAPGFLYSVGISPPLAAAALESIRLMKAEPERLERLHCRGSSFLKQAKESGINTGKSAGYSVIPVMAGSSTNAVTLSNILFEKGINVQPIMRPAVEDKAARLRFFISSEHTETQISQTIEAVKQALSKLT